MTTTPTSGAAIQRYKIGYHADEWGQRSSTPSGIPDASGSWVRYADHIAALAAGQATAAQQEAAYAELPDAKTLGEAVAAWIGVETRGAHKRVDTTVDRLGFAVRSVVGDMLRASNGQAPAGAVPLTCEWAHNENDGFWESACGEAWRFDDGGPAENSMHFCHSCGKSLRINAKEAGNAE